MPRPTAAPLVLSAGIALTAVGVATSYVFMIVVVSCSWPSDWAFGSCNCLPGRGHEHEPLVEPQYRPRAVTAVTGDVERIRRGMPGYRLRLPERVHPISAGIKGGLVGGLIMPIPAMLYGVLSGHGVWMPINLLSGMVLPGRRSIDNCRVGSSFVPCWWWSAAAFTCAFR